MTDKQIEAIERCNELIKDDHKEWMGLSNQHAIETVLNLLEKQKKEIENYKKNMAIISEICIDESKLHITSRQAIKEVRNYIIC